MCDDLIDLLEHLSDVELLELCGQLPASNKVQGIIEREQEKGELELLRDEAYSRYCQRRLDMVSVLDAESVITLLRLPETATARSILGDAARLNKLSSQHMEMILAHVAPSGWVYRQVLARQIVHRFSQRISNTGDEMIGFEKTISSLIDLKATWAILDIVPLLTHRELTTVLDRMQSPPVLNRHARHQVREAIQTAFDGIRGQNPGQFQIP